MKNKTPNKRPSLDSSESYRHGIKLLGKKQTALLGAYLPISYLIR